MLNEIIYQLYETSIEMLKSIRELSIRNGLNNDQKFIFWQDELNALSLDVN